ncbi:MAG: hypothetical protein ACREQN_01515, partial [Candidatus Binataceae bacterium]
MGRLRQPLLTGVVALALALATAALAHDLGAIHSDNAAAGSGGGAAATPSAPRPSPAQITIPMDADAMESAAGDAEMKRHGAPDDGRAGLGMGGAMEGHIQMNGHMAWSDPRPANRADNERAAEIVATLRAAISKYKDYRVAERADYKPFHPEIKQRIVHFTNYWYAFKAGLSFNPAEPTSLLYKPLPGGGYELVGAMYTAPARLNQDRLNRRVPLSVARWHRHVDLCFPGKADAARADWTRFGFTGTITTKAQCDAAGGRFYSQLFGWMVHV